MKDFRLAVFDLAGTTVVDTNTVGSCLQQALSNVGLEVSVEDVNKVMGIQKPLAIQALLNQYGVEGDVAEIHDDFRDIMIRTYKTSAAITEIPGASKLFAELNQLGIRIAVDTGFDREITDVLLDRMQWGELLSDSITSDEVAQGRPHADMIVELCRRAGVQPHQVIKIGDTPADIQEGQSAQVGLNVGVTYGSHTRELLLPFGPDKLIDSLDELLEFCS